MNRPVRKVSNRTLFIHLSKNYKIFFELDYLWYMNQMHSNLIIGHAFFGNIKWFMIRHIDFDVDYAQIDFDVAWFMNISI